MKYSWLWCALSDSWIIKVRIDYIWLNKRLNMKLFYDVRSCQSSMLLVNCRDSWRRLTLIDSRNLSWERRVSSVSLRNLLSESSLLEELSRQEVLQLELVFVSVVRNVNRSASGADPVCADRTRVPGREAAHGLLLVTRWLGAAVDEGGDVGGDVEQHHVVTLTERGGLKLRF